MKVNLMVAGRQAGLGDETGHCQLVGWLIKVEGT